MGVLCGVTVTTFFRFYTILLKLELILPSILVLISFIVGTVLLVRQMEGRRKMLKDDTELRFVTIVTLIVTIVTLLVTTVTLVGIALLFINLQNLQVRNRHSGSLHCNLPYL